jgi:hypothetical protein
MLDYRQYWDMETADYGLLIQVIWEEREETFDGSFHLPTVLLQKKA